MDLLVEDPVTMRDAVQHVKVDITRGCHACAGT